MPAPRSRSEASAPWSAPTIAKSARAGAAPASPRGRPALEVDGEDPRAQVPVRRRRLVHVQVVLRRLAGAAEAAVRLQRIEEQRAEALAELADEGKPARVSADNSLGLPAGAAVDWLAPRSLTEQGPTGGALESLGAGKVSADGARIDLDGGVKALTWLLIRRR